MELFGLCKKYFLFFLIPNETENCEDFVLELIKSRKIAVRECVFLERISVTKCKHVCTIRAKLY